MGVEGETESEREGEKTDPGGGGGGKRKVGRTLEEQEKKRQRWEEWERKRYKKLREVGEAGGGEGLRRETLKDVDTETQNPREGPTEPMISLTILPVRPSPNGPQALGLRSPAHPGKTGQIPADSAILASACKGSREGRRQADGWGGGVKGDMVAPALGRGGDGHRWRKGALNSGYQARSQPGTDLGQ